MQYLYVTRTMDNTGRIDRMDVTNGTTGSAETVIEESGHHFTSLVYDLQHGYVLSYLVSKKRKVSPTNETKSVFPLSCDYAKQITFLLFTQQKFMETSYALSSSFRYMYWIRHTTGGSHTGAIYTSVLDDVDSRQIVAHYEGCSTVSMAVVHNDLYLNCGGEITAYSKNGVHISLNLIKDL